MKNILLCSDLDRTILPNGDSAESSNARACLKKLVSRPEVTLAYVSGRDKSLLEAAISEYDIPVPDFAIGDVGTSIYQISDNHWHVMEQWSKEISPDWNGRSRSDIGNHLNKLSDLKLQEPEKQNDYKLSYYIDLNNDVEQLLRDVKSELVSMGVNANAIFSIDDLTHVGLLDILPASADKYHAITFLMKLQGFSQENTVFAGDSGNDIAVLASDLKSVLVNNARKDVREKAIALSEQAGHADTLYLAHGAWLDMNGNYSAGVVEGVIHYFPDYLGVLST